MIQNLFSSVDFGLQEGKQWLRWLVSIVVSSFFGPLKRLARLLGTPRGSPVIICEWVMAKFVAILLHRLPLRENRSWSSTIIDTRTNCFKINVLDRYTHSATIEKESVDFVKQIRTCLLENIECWPQVPSAVRLVRIISSETSCNTRS